MNLKILSVILFVLVFVTSCEKEVEYDIVILNGRVLDPETNFDAVRNVGIKDGIISTIIVNNYIFVIIKCLIVYGRHAVNYEFTIIIIGRI